MEYWAIETYDVRGSGPRLGVKDLIDLEGTKTSAGSRLVLSQAVVAEQDAELMAGARRQGAQIVAKTNLTELAFGATGINPWFGTPRNPFDPELIPGGSSSGSAVGVATGELDVAYGSDTGGSIRIPSACCGIFGLKTTFGRISLKGVWPLSPSLDSVGPMAADADRLELGMALLEPGFRSQSVSSPKIGLLEESGPLDVLEAISKVLGLVSSDVTNIGDPGLLPSWEAGLCIMFTEALQANRSLLSQGHRLDPAVMHRYEAARKYNAADLARSNGQAKVFSTELANLFQGVDFLALPSLKVGVPTLSNAHSVPLNANTLPFNLAGLPAISVPVPLNADLRGYLSFDDRFAPLGYRKDLDQPIPLSIEIVGPHNSEEKLIGLAKAIEVAVTALGS